MLTFDTMSERAQVPAAAQPLYDVMAKARCGGCTLSGCWSVSDLPNACKRAACPARHRRGPRAESGTECPARSAYCISHVCIWSALADTVPCPCASCLARSGLRSRLASSGPGGVTPAGRRYDCVGLGMPTGFQLHLFSTSGAGQHHRGSGLVSFVRAQQAGQVGDAASSVHPKEPPQAGRNCTRQPSLDLGMVSCDGPGKSEAQKHYCTRALQPRTALSFPGSRRILRKFHSEGAWVESAKNLRATCMQHASDYRCYGRCLCAPLEYHPDWFLGVCCSEGVRHLLLHFVSSHRDGVQALPGEDPRPQRERPCQVCGSG